MKKIIYNLLALFILIELSSCSKVLDKQSLSEYSETAVWSDLAMMEHYVNNIYYYISQSFDRPMLGALTDEALMDPGSDYGQINTMKSLITASDLITFDRGMTTQKLRWENCYSMIRACNLFLEQVELNTYSDEGLKNRLTGEVYFLRAHYYHNLAFLYGGVPVIAKTYKLNEEFTIARNTFEETIDFIVDDCDKAAALLPVKQTGVNYGRVTKGAALSLKSRVLLYAASDLYNSNGSWTKGYAHPELVGFVGGDRTARWQTAKEAALAVMSMGEYSLYKEEPAPGDSVAQNYNEIFLTKGKKEDIFVRNFTPSNQNWTYNIGIQNLPVGYHGWGNVHVINSMVDEYEMSNGDKFSWDNPEHKADPYKNREPRFYSDIFYNGSKWRQRPSDVIALDPNGIVQTGSYEQTDGSFQDGIDGKMSPVSTWTGTYTGYYLRKFQDITVDAPLVISPVQWHFVRYAEILLNYAEACVELGQDNDARLYVNKIRKRAGLPDITTSGDELRESVRHERKIELMFEDKRFYDIRRWMIAPEVITNGYGVNIRYARDASKPTYNPVMVTERIWNDCFYFLPIKLDELNRNKLLIQNPLY